MGIGIGGVLTVSGVESPDSEDGVLVCLKSPMMMMVIVGEGLLRGFGGCI